jgi:hypothetical protein
MNDPSTMPTSDWAGENENSIMLPPIGTVNQNASGRDAKDGDGAAPPERISRRIANRSKNLAKILDIRGAIVDKIGSVGICLRPACAKFCFAREGR